jgi:hypothetical protein
MYMYQGKAWPAPWKIRSQSSRIRSASLKLVSKAVIPSINGDVVISSPVSRRFTNTYYISLRILRSFTDMCSCVGDHEVPGLIMPSLRSLPFKPCV